MVVPTSIGYGAALQVQTLNLNLSPYMSATGGGGGPRGGADRGGAHVHRLRRGAAGAKTLPYTLTSACALSAVVAGLVEAPVVVVPTSTGYVAALHVNQNRNPKPYMSCLVKT